MPQDPSRLRTVPVFRKLPLGLALLASLGASGCKHDPIVISHRATRIPAPGTINVVLLNGNTGKPMSNERLLFFFNDQDDPTHNQSAEAHTGADGTVTLHLPANPKPYFQVFADFQSVCWKHPNTVELSLQQVITNGALTPNNCGQVVTSASRGELVVFARPATLLEQMAW